MDHQVCPRGNGAKILAEPCPWSQGQPEKYPGGCPLCEGFGWVETEGPQCDGTGIVRREN